MSKTKRFCLSNYSICSGRANFAVLAMSVSAALCKDGDRCSECIGCDLAASFTWHVPSH